MISTKRNLIPNQKKSYSQQTKTVSFYHVKSPIYTLATKNFDVLLFFSSFSLDWFVCSVFFLLWVWLIIVNYYWHSKLMGGRLKWAILLFWQPVILIVFFVFYSAHWRMNIVVVVVYATVKWCYVYNRHCSDIGISDWA